MRYFVSAGEPSGDMHLAFLVKHIKLLNKEAKFFGAAGSRSKNEGVEIIQDIEEMAVMGFKEIAGRYSFFKKKLYEYIEFIKKNSIKNVIMVDYGGFNLAFLKILKREIKDIKVFYYIPPKLWVWGEWRIRKLKLADEILAIFPWEVEFYKKKNIEAVYFGNPLADLRKEVESFGESILLLPGSRKQEILSLFPVMNKCAEIMKEKKFILKLADRGDLRFISEIADNIEVDFDSTLEEICSKCKIAIAASGTVTLELALMGLPSIVVYKTSKINEFIARRIINVKYVSLPNLVKNSEVYKELLQKNMSVENIIKEIVNIEANYKNKKKELKDIREKLGGSKIISKYAAYIAERSSND